MVLRPLLYILNIILVSCEWIALCARGRKRSSLYSPVHCLGGSVSTWLGPGRGMLLPRCFGLRHCWVFDLDKAI